MSLRTSLRAAGAALAALSLAAVSSVPLAPAAVAAPGDPQLGSGAETSVAKVKGKGVGSGRWGIAGAVETVGSGGTTYNYGVQFAPDGSLWVTDSGKVAFGYQSGTPRVFRYAKTGSDFAQGQYTVNGAWATGWNGGLSGGSANAGIGANWQAVGQRTVISAPYTAPKPNVKNGPRPIAFDKDGRAWIVNSENGDPYSADESAPHRKVQVFRPDGSLDANLGWEGTWPDRDHPGVTFYGTGAATTPDGKILTTSEVSNRLNVFDPTTTQATGQIRLDLPPDSDIPGDKGYRAPYGVAVDPVDGSIYTALIDFRDAPSMKTLVPYVEKRDPSGKLLAKLKSPSGAAPFLRTGDVVFNVVVNPHNRHVFAWSQTNSGVVEWDEAGNFVRSWNASNNTTRGVAKEAGIATEAFPGMGTVRGLAFDDGGRMYLTVNQGGSSMGTDSSPRVMILGQTPASVMQGCACRSADGTSARLSWTFDDKTQAGLENGNGGLPVRDFVVEQSEDGGTRWKAVPANSPSIERSRTITGLDPEKKYAFRVSAWNEAGNGDWHTLTDARQAKAEDDAADFALGTSPTVDVLANDTAGDDSPLDAGAKETLALVGADKDGNPTYVDTLTVQGEGTYTVKNGTVVFTPVEGLDTTGPLTPVTYAIGAPGCRVTAQLRLTAQRDRIALTKQGTLASGATGAVGDRLDWTFTVENTGTTTLRDVAIADDLAGMSDIEVAWPDAAHPGVLEVGQKATATAHSSVTQEQRVAGVAANTAHVTAQGMGEDQVKADAEARVTLPEVPPEPTTDPTTEPTVDPTPDPTDGPTDEPTGTPTTDPTDEPTEPSTPPTEPTVDPTEDPTTEPTQEPTGSPTPAPTTTGGPTSGAPSPSTSAPSTTRPSTHSPAPSTSSPGRPGAPGPQDPPEDRRPLPRTGAQGVAAALIAGAFLVAGGLLIALRARRRR